MAVSLALVVLLLGADPTARFGGSPSDPIPPDDAAAIALDAQEAQDEVAKKYGNKRPSELSNEERSQMIKDQAAAEKKVLDKHGVSPSTWARQQMAQSPQEAAAQKERVKALADKRKADAAAKDQEKPEQPVQVQRGISDSNPVTLEETASDTPVVEQGLPAEAAADQAEAAGQGASDTAAPAVEEKAPAKAAGKGGKSGGKGSGKR